MKKSSASRNSSIHKRAESGRKLGTNQSAKNLHCNNSVKNLFDQSAKVAKHRVKDSFDSSRKSQVSNGKPARGLRPSHIPKSNAAPASDKKYSMKKSASGKGLPSDCKSKTDSGQTSSTGGESHHEQQPEINKIGMRIQMFQPFVSKRNGASKSRNGGTVEAIETMELSPQQDSPSASEPVDQQQFGDSKLENNDLTEVRNIVQCQIENSVQKNRIAIGLSQSKSRNRSIERSHTSVSNLDLDSKSRNNGSQQRSYSRGLTIRPKSGLVKDIQADSSVLSPSRRLLSQDTEVDKLRTTVATLNQRLKNLTNTDNTQAVLLNKLDAADEEMTKLREANSLMKRDNRTLQNRVQEVQRDMIAQQELYRKNTNEIKEKRAESTCLKKIQKEQQSKISLLEQQVEQQNVKMTKFTNDNQQSANALKSLQDQNKQLQDQIHSQSKQICDKTDLLLDLQAKIQDLKQEYQTRTKSDFEKIEGLENELTYLETKTRLNYERFGSQVSTLLIRNNQLEKGQCFYIPKRTDRIDKTLAQFLNNQPDRKKLKIVFVRESEGVYKFGERKVLIKVMKGNQVGIRVDGGVLPVAEFIEQYTSEEMSKIKRNQNCIENFKYQPGQQIISIDKSNNHINTSMRSVERSNHHKCNKSITRSINRSGSPRRDYMTQTSAGRRRARSPGINSNHTKLHKVLDRIVEEKAYNQAIKHKIQICKSPQKP